jgi:hypothetical protein
MIEKLLPVNVWIDIIQYITVYNIQNHVFCIVLHPLIFFIRIKYPNNVWLWRFVQTVFRVVSLAISQLQEH